MVYFVGAGTGAADLITVRGMHLLEKADVIIYAGSLVNPELLKETKPGCEILNSAYMTLDEVIDAMEKAEEAGKMTVRLHTGDPSIYGAIREQMDELDKMGVSYDVTPGVSSFSGAAASMVRPRRTRVATVDSFSPSRRAISRLLSSSTHFSSSTRR